MSIPDAAIEAAAPEIQRVIEGWMNYDDEDWTLLARAAIDAAMPAIREAIAQEIDTATLNLEGDLAHTAERVMAALDVKHQCVNIARGCTR